MGLRETSHRLANKGVTSIVGNVAKTITYKVSSGEVFPDSSNPLFKEATFTSYTIKAVVSYAKNQSLESMLVRNNPFDIKLLIDSTQMVGISFSSRDRIVVDSLTYVITQINYNDPAQATVVAFCNLEIA